MEPLSQQELAEIETAVRNGVATMAQLSSGARFSHAGAVSALVHTIRYLQGRFPKPAPPPAEPPPAEPGG